MTLFERVEALAARVGELEARLAKPAPVVADPVERLPSDDAPIGALEAISEPVTFAGDRWPAGGGGVAGQKMWGHESVPGAIWVGDEPPTKEQERMLVQLREAVVAADYWIDRWRTDEDHADDADWYMRKVDAALARARVATEGP